MTIHRGEVVLLTFPFTDGSGSKIRPALVVQTDRNNERLRNTVVAMITSTTRTAGEPTQLLIAIETEEGRQSGLLHTSVVKCENLFTIEQRLILRSIGTLSPAALMGVDACLRAALGLR